MISAICSVSISIIGGGNAKRLTRLRQSSPRIAPGPRNASSACWTSSFETINSLMASCFLLSLVLISPLSLFVLSAKSTNIPTFVGKAAEPAGEKKRKEKKTNPSAALH